MQVSEFNYELPPELIAQRPLPERDRSRMLIVDRTAASWRDGVFAELPSLLLAGDVLVINNTRVFPARLIGRRRVNGRPGARVEVLLLRCVAEADNEWLVLAKPGGALRRGAELEFGDGRLRAVVIEQLEEGRRRLRFETTENFEQLVDAIGHTPLPPYIKRDRNQSQRLLEPEYQTIYARRRGAIAAPTAGLHFTERILNELRLRQIKVVEITHHVGYATFQPVRVQRVEEHRIEAESYEISTETAAAINTARQQGGRVVAVGTTTVRALESAAEIDGSIRAEERMTELFIYPGYQFRAVDALITNFHLPQSSLLMLVAAFAGKELTLSAYRHAVAQRYRFYSYGDCMLII